MKKIIAMFLAVVMCMSLCAFASAEAAVQEINWADLQESGAELIAKGEFTTFDEIAVQMWVPTAFAALELGEEDTEAGYIAYFMPEDESAAIAVMYVDVDGMSLEEYKEMLPEYGATEIEDCVVNGLPAVTYVLEDDDTVCIAFATEAGYLLEVSASPKSDEGFASVVMFVMASIQAAE